MKEETEVSGFRRSVKREKRKEIFFYFFLFCEVDNKVVRYTPLDGSTIVKNHDYFTVNSN